MEGTQRVGLTGVGMALPEQVLDTDDLQARLVENSDLAMPAGLIRTLTGIETRRVARDDEYASTFAIQAARLALAQAGLEPADVDLLIFASAGRDMVEPATAHIVQHELGTQGHCFDLTNACNSFVNGIDVARSTILAGRATRVLVVTGETPTRVMRWKLADLEQARAAMAGFTFGDAGAAVVVESVGRGGILDIDTLTRSEHWAVGGVPGGGSRLPRGDDHTYFRGDGRGLG
jgi:3-oxoacyl-[acyl-carrier-protein] synthase-3